MLGSDSDHFVGVIECQAVDPHSRSTELGYWLDERHTGLGLASRACDVLLAHAFNELKLHKVVIRCPVGHDKSAGVARRLGFTQEGLLRAHRWLHESPVDEYVFGLLAHEWTQRGEEPDPSDSDEARPA